MNNGLKSSSSFWSWIGKIATLVGLLYGLVQLLGLFNRPEYSIEVYGEHYDIIFPDSFQFQLDKLKQSLNSDSIQARLPEKARVGRYDVYRAINDYFVNAFPSDLENSIKDIKSIWFFKIINDGTKEVGDLNLELPFEGRYMLKRSGQNNSSGLFQNLIPIGSLRPSNELTIIVWSEEYTSSYDEKDTRVTHPNGLTAINYPVTVRGIVAWNERNYGRPLILSIVVLILLFLGIFYLGVWAESKSQHKTPTKTEIPQSEVE